MVARSPVGSTLVYFARATRMTSCVRARWSLLSNNLPPSEAHAKICIAASHVVLIFLLGSETLLFFRSPRSCRVHIEFPKIEVRYEDLTVDAYVHVGSRALPTIPNFICNMTEVGP